ncbi:hypothetical protein OH76DRAFT_927510 [Lentinus brumalis]|uniref:Uncharacterized protein n=1 Tax=Lentinus brumalis TaxID=2498619 RepID=A0A371D014_9APHY|nr:hypothetical protein OH76DRAFT_927510 [Polyporus brumalis]
MVEMNSEVAGKLVGIMLTRPKLLTISRYLLSAARPHPRLDLTILACSSCESSCHRPTILRSRIAAYSPHSNRRCAARAVTARMCSFHFARVPLTASSIHRCGVQRTAASLSGAVMFVGTNSCMRLSSRMSEVHRPLWVLYRTSQPHTRTADLSSGLKRRTDIEIGTSVEAESSECSALELASYRCTDSTRAAVARPPTDTRCAARSSTCSESSRRYL